jgi:transglutaminase-like putative cysteine protease
VPGVLAVLDVLGLVLVVRSAPPRLVAAAERATWLLLFFTGLFGLAWTIYPLIPAAVARVFPRLAGYGLALLCAFLLSARRHASPPRALVPAALGTLVVAAFDPAAPLRWPMIVAALSIVGGLLAEAGGGWRRLARITTFAFLSALLAAAIVRLLPWAQPFVESAVVRMIAPPGGESGFSLDSRLGDAPELTLSPRVLMHVTTNAPLKLRAGVFVRFDGAQWRALGPPPRPLVVEGGAIGGALGSWLDGLPGRVFAVPAAPLDEAWLPTAVRTRIVQVAPVIGALPAPGEPLLVRRSSSVAIDAAGVLGPSVRGLETYGVVSSPPGAPRPAPAAPADEPALLALPADLDPRLLELAARLRDSGGSSVEARLQRTVTFIQSQCRYSLRPGRFRTKQPVAEFLFEKKKGYCEYFATAAAVLLRLQDVPVRYVRGFTVREANRLGGHYVVREADAHAWIEAFVPGRGFVEVDATPAGEYEAAHGGIERGGLQALFGWLSGRWAEVRALIAARAGWTVVARLAEVAKGLVRGRPGLVKTSLILLAAVWLFRRVWPVVRKLRERRRARRRAKEPAAAPELAALLARIDRLWTRHGRRRPLFRAPLEHLASIPPGALPAAVRAGSERVVEAYYRGRFAGHAVTAGEVRSLHQALEAAASRKAAS